MTKITSSAALPASVSFTSVASRNLRVTGTTTLSGQLKIGDATLYRGAANRLTTSSEFQVNLASVNAFQIGSMLNVDSNSYRIAFGGAPYAAGNMTITLANTNAAPSASIAGGGILYADAGALKWRGSSGTVTIIAPA